MSVCRMRYFWWHLATDYWVRYSAPDAGRSGFRTNVMEGGGEQMKSNARMADRVLVIGAGVSGLTTAKCLIDAGFDVTIVSEHPAERGPSVVAGALWEWPPAVCGHHRDPDSLSRSKEWAAVSYERFSRLSGDVRTGVRMAQAVFYFRQRIDDSPRENAKMDEAAARVHGFEHSADLIERHGVNSGLGFRDAYTYHAPLIDTGVYVAWLRVELEATGCRFEQHRLDEPLSDSADRLCREYGAVAVVNCSGLGSIDLAGDPMQPLRGALVRVRNDGAAMPKVSVAHCVAYDDAAEDQQMIYIIPRGEDGLLLGGIAELGEWDTRIDLDHSHVRGIVRRCRDFLPALQFAEIELEEPVRVGLRPYREKNVRVEAEPGRRIVHNYGHGGSGFSFSWGCAEESARLVESIVSIVGN